MPNIKKMNVKKFDKIVICCDNCFDMNVAFTLKEFLSSLKINVLLHKHFVSTKRCIADRLNKKSMLICIAHNRPILKGKGRITDNTEINKRLEKIYLSKNLKEIKKHFALGCFSINEDGSTEINIDLSLLRKFIDYCLKSNRYSPSITSIAIHEILHLKYLKHCKDKDCLAHKSTGNVYLCKSCRKKFKKVIEEKFKQYKKGGKGL